MMVVLVGCGSRDWEKKLPNNYRLVSTSPYTAFIYLPSTERGDDVVVPPHIVEIGQQGSLLIGRLETNVWTVEFAARQGWFTLDVSTGKVELGLSHTELKEKVGERAPKIKLQKPRAFQPRSS